MIDIDGARNRVMGVAPQWLEGLYAGSTVDIWMLLQDKSGQGIDRSSRTFWAVGRLRPGVSPNGAQAIVNTTRDGPDLIAVLPYTGMTPEVSSGMSRIGTLLSAAAGAVFFIACINVMTFLLSRASARSRETAIRVALGASRGQLAKQLLSDSVVISVAGGALGMVLAVWTADVIPALLLISATVLLTGFRTALQTKVGQRLNQSILAAPGSRPPWQSIRIEAPHLPLRDVVMAVVAFTPQSLDMITLPPIQGRMFGGGDTPRSCKVVIVNEEAAKEFFEEDAIGRSIEDPEGQRVEIIGVVATRKAGSTTTRIDPTVYYYAEQSRTPLDRVGAARFRVSVRPEPPRAVLEANVVSPSYFDAMGISPVAGRIFSSDPAAGGCRVGVINQEANERYFGGNAVGGAVIDATGQRTEIVGVVHSTLLRASQRRAEPTIYFPLEQDFLPLMTLILGAREANDATLTLIRTTLNAVPGGRSPAVVRTLEEHLSRIALAPERIAMVLVSVSAAMALALGVLGLYGAMNDAARQRRREFGIRLALGAKGWRLVREVLAEGIRLAAAGTVAGLLGSLLVARWLAQITPGAGPLPIWVWLAAPLALLGAVAIASVLPSHRALAADPLTIMRDE